MDEVAFGHLVLSVLGVSGVLEYYGTRRVREFWPAGKCLLVGIGAAPTYLAGALLAFTSLSGASSLQLFGFLGCVLGLLGAVRLMADGADARELARQTRNG
jgi:hypothetical protein